VLVRIAQGEAARRGPRLAITGPELDDLAYQAAADALVVLPPSLFEHPAAELSVDDSAQLGEDRRQYAADHEGVRAYGERAGG
jgi:hypothetical protein